jgi:thermostable 8-oxoguanine DNA glycosylase
MTAVASPCLRAGRGGDRALHADWELMRLAFAQAYDELVVPGPPAGEIELRRELLFCLLGGHGITFELSLSAVQVVEKLDVFGPGHDANALQEELFAVLSDRRYGPPRTNGALRRYRFPARKAALITQARSWLLATGSLSRNLALRSCERERRSWLIGCPGLGPKSASWMLRNTGWAHELAILDIHVLRAMADAEIISDVRLPGDYEVVERRFLDWCSRLDVAPGVFDLFLWEWQRGTLRPRTEAVTL